MQAVRPSAQRTPVTCELCQGAEQSLPITFRAGMWGPQPRREHCRVRLRDLPPGSLLTNGTNPLRFISPPGPPGHRQEGVAILAEALLPASYLCPASLARLNPLPLRSPTLKSSSLNTETRRERLQWNHLNQLGEVKM